MSAFVTTAAGGALDIHQGLYVNGAPIVAPAGTPVFAGARKYYLDADAPAGGDGSILTPWQSLAEFAAGLPGVPNGTYVLYVAPGDYGSPLDPPVTWPTDAATKVFAITGANQVTTNFLTPVVVTPTSFDFFIAGDLSFASLTFNTVAAQSLIVNLVRCGLGNNGPPGLVTTAIPPIVPGNIRVFFLVNCGVNNATLGGNYVSATDCSFGPTAVGAGATLNIDGGFYLLGDGTATVDVAAGGTLRTTGVIFVNSVTGAGPPRGAGPTAVWETDGTSDFSDPSFPYGYSGTLTKISPSTYITCVVNAAPNQVAMLAPLAQVLGTETSGFLLPGPVPAKAGTYQVQLAVSAGGAPLAGTSSFQVYQGAPLGVAATTLATPAPYLLHTHTGLFNATDPIMLQITSDALLPLGTVVNVTITRLA